MGLRTPRLLALGLIRFALMVIVVMSSAGLILAYYQEILGSIWQKPQGMIAAGLWHILSWILSLILMALSALLSYLLAQILFGAIIMDMMAQETEKIVTGQVNRPERLSVARQMAHMMVQEIPRAVFPILSSITLFIAGWLTPAGPVISLISSITASIFLAWDNTDIIPARNMAPFRQRLRFLKRNLPFHFGFGLCFFIPFLNILLLSFAPVGGTLYHIDVSRENRNQQ